MKNLTLLLLFFCATKSYAQDTTFRIKQIDSLVSNVNHSNTFYVRHDSSIQDMPTLKLNIKTYTTTVMNSRDLKKYTSNVRSKSEENGIKKDLNTSSTFYYNLGQLIKVEEYMTDGSHEQRYEWYYADGKPLYNISTPPIPASKSSKMNGRASNLLTIAQGIKTQEESRIPKM